MLKISVLLVLLVVAYWALSSLEPRTLYYPDGQMDATPRAYGLNFEEVWLTTSDGKRINAWWVPGKPSNFTTLFCNGNAGNISHRLDKLQRLHKMGLNVLLFDYRGYGQSEGTPSEAGTYADAEAAFTYLTQTKGIPTNKIIVHGESLGCAVAVEMARRHPVAALIVESGFTSTVDMAKRIFPWLPVRWIVRYRYDNLSKISQIKVPILILHSPQDDIVPFEMGRKLYEAAPQPKRFVELRGDHNEGFITSGEIYTRGIADFIEMVK